MGQSDQGRQDYDRIAARQCLHLARMRPPAMSAFTPLLGDERTCRRRGQTDAVDPLRTCSRAAGCLFTEEERTGVALCRGQLGIEPGRCARRIKLQSRSQGYSLIPRYPANDFGVLQLGTWILVALPRARVVIFRGQGAWRPFGRSRGRVERPD